MPLGHHDEALQKFSEAVSDMSNHLYDRRVAVA